MKALSPSGIKKSPRRAPFCDAEQGTTETVSGWTGPSSPCAWTTMTRLASCQVAGRIAREPNEIIRNLEHGTRLRLRDGARVCNVRSTGNEPLNGIEIELGHCACSIEKRVIERFLAKSTRGLVNVLCFFGRGLVALDVVLRG